MGIVREEVDVERHRLGALVIYEVTGDQLDQLETEATGLSDDLTFATAGVSAGIAFLLALLTVDIASDRLFTVFLVLTVAMFLLAAVCGVRWYRSRKKFKGVVARIKGIGPLGQQGKEINPTELAASEPQEPGSQGQPQ